MAAPEPQLFLSYRSLERGFASRLAADLKNAGVGLWMDSLDIKPGTDWDRAIENALSTCAGVVAIISPGYVSSDICRAEVGRSHALMKPVIPVLLERVAAADWPLLLQNSNYLDFTGWRDPPTYAHRFDQLVLAIGENFEGIAGDAPDPELQYLTTLLAEVEASRGVLEYVPLNTVAKPGAPRRERPDEWAFDVLLEVGPGAADQYTTRLSDIDEVVRRRRVVLLGAAGAGKTTTLRWIVRRAAQARLADPRTQPLPVLVLLSRWRSGQSFADLLSEVCPLLGSADGGGRAEDLVLLLDGLNEMGSDGPERVAAMLEWLEGLPANSSVIATCRTGDYGSLALPGFTTASLRALDDEQVHGFAEKYLKGEAPKFLAQVLNPAGRVVDASMAVHDLVRNPYMLSAFIFLFQNTQGQPLPTNTGSLFSRLSRALWERERRRIEPAGEPWTAARTALARVGRSMFEAQEREDVPVAWVIARLEDAQLLDQGIAADLLVRHGDFVRFSHDLLRTYFVAEAVANLDASEFNEWCRAHPWPGWQSVAVAWSGISPQADQFVQQLHWEEAAELAQRGYVAGEAAFSGHVERAVQNLAFSHWRDFQPAIDALVRYGQIAVPALISALADPDPETRGKAVFVLGRIGTEDAIDALLPLFDDSSADVRGRLVAALTRIGGERALRALAGRRSDESPMIRAAAVEAIVELDESESAMAVVELLDDPEPGVRRAAIVGAGKLGVHDAADQIAGHLQDRDGETRAAALTALAQLGIDVGPHALAALRDAEEVVRRAAVSSLESMGAEGVAPLLAALSDGSPQVRAESAAALGRLRDGRTLHRLSAALSDESPAVRQAATVAIGHFGEEARDTLVGLLRGRDSSLWQSAADALHDQGWTPGTTDDNVRLHAATGHWARCLGIGEPAIPELRRLLSLADGNRQAKAAETLNMLGWRPQPRDPDVILFYEHLVDWEQHGKLSIPELLDLGAWVGARTDENRPARQLARTMLAQLDGSVCSDLLEARLTTGNERSRYFATVVAGMARCSRPLTQIRANLAAPPAGEVEWGWGWQVRSISAQTLADVVGDADLAVVGELLDRAATVIAERREPFFANAEAVACIQSTARILGLVQAFDTLPASALGPSQPGGNPSSELSDLWIGFGLDEQPIEQWTVSAVVGAIATFDRSQLPDWSPLYSDLALMRFHVRMASLTLVLLGAIESALIQAPLQRALDSMSQIDVMPVMAEVPAWSGDRLAALAGSSNSGRDWRSHASLRGRMTALWAKLRR